MNESMKIQISKKPEIKQLWIRYGDVICPECKARFNDDIFSMFRDDAEFRYCPNCGKPVNKDYEVTIK